MPAAGVLALQGDFDAHSAMLAQLGLETRLIRRPEQLDGISMLCMPGGESTTMSMLLDSSGLREPLTELISGGLPVFATCAGLILLAGELSGDRGSVKVRPLGLLDAAVDRNSYGRQVDSFEDSVEMDWSVLGQADSGPLPAMFIRAPRITSIGPQARACGWHAGEAVLLRQGNIIGATFHPEISGDPRIHQALAALAGQL
jgi:pyridoxal 5'-phosphate synthase pdxT subunit